MTINTPDLAVDAFFQIVGSKGGLSEDMVVLWLSANLELIGYSRRTGDCSQVAVDPCGVVREAVVAGAITGVAVHNHPSGGVVASSQDRMFADRLREALRTVGIQLSDFIIVGVKSDGSVDRYSFKESRFL